MLWLPLPDVLSVLLSSNLIGIKKHRHLLSSCKCHSLSISYHSKTEWVSYQRKNSHVSNGEIQAVNKSRSQQSAWPSNHPRVQSSHPVCKIMTLLCCYLFLFCKHFKHENPIICNNEICNMNPIIIVLFETYSTYLSKYCANLPTWKIVPCYMKYIKSQFLILWSVNFLLCFLSFEKVKNKTLEKT